MNLTDNGLVSYLSWPRHPYPMIRQKRWYPRGFLGGRGVWHASYRWMPFTGSSFRSRHNR